MLSKRACKSKLDLDKSHILDCWTVFQKFWHWKVQVRFSRVSCLECFALVLSLVSHCWHMSCCLTTFVARRTILLHHQPMYLFLEEAGNTRTLRRSIKIKNITRNIHEFYYILCVMWTCFSNRQTPFLNLLKPSCRFARFLSRTTNKFRNTYGISGWAKARSFSSCVGCRESSLTSAS